MRFCNTERGGDRRRNRELKQNGQKHITDRKLKFGANRCQNRKDYR